MSVPELQEENFKTLELKAQDERLLDPQLNK